MKEFTEPTVVIGNISVEPLSVSLGDSSLTTDTSPGWLPGWY